MQKASLKIVDVKLGMLGQHIKMSKGKPIYDAEFYMFQRVIIKPILIFRVNLIKFSSSLQTT